MFFFRYHLTWRKKEHWFVRKVSTISTLQTAPRNKMLVRSKFLLQFVKKMGKLKIHLSKQHDKMLKIKSEMLKIRKNVKIIKLEKISRENVRQFPESQ